MAGHTLLCTSFSYPERLSGSFLHNSSEIVKTIQLLTGVFLWQFSILVQQYLSYPVQTDLTIVRSSAATFPAVTVCNNNPVKKGLVAKVKNYADLAALDDFVESEMLAAVVDDLDIGGVTWDCDSDEAECVEDKVENIVETR